MSTILIVGRDSHTAEFASALAGVEAIRHTVASLADADVRDVSTVVDLTLGSTDEHAAIAAMFRGRATPVRVAVSALSVSATEAAAYWTPAPVVSLAWMPGLTASSDSVELGAALGLDPVQTRSLCDDFAQMLGRRVELVADRVGLVSCRILAMVINEAAFAVMEGVASPADVDTAMRLGTNYPSGPLAWADAIGADVIVHLLDALARDYGEDRYRVCVLLRQHARAGLPFHSAVAAHQTT